MHDEAHWQERRGFRILGLTHGIGSNKRELINNAVYFERGEIYSQITNWERLEPVEYGKGMDSYIHLFDEPELPFDTCVEGNELNLQGDLSRLERDVQDRRWTIFGNMGIWFRHALVTQEKRGIYSLHAAAVYKPDHNELMIIAGKAGAGKSVFLLESIIRGYQIFSTEMTFFQYTPGGVEFLRGALMDNIRAGCLEYDFPEAAGLLGVALPKTEQPWEEKISIDLRPVSTKQSKLLNPVLSIIFPRIEKGYHHAVVRDITDPRVLIRRMYDVASEKIGNTYLMYEELPAIGLDTPELARLRLEAVATLVAAPHWEIKQARTTLAGPKSCMEVIDE